MTKILKGDTSANITIAFATGYDYAGSTVHVDFLGARRSFANVTAGGTVSFNFTAEETKAMPLGTFPVHVTLVKNGLITTIKNGGVKISVTDDISEVHAGAAIAVDVKGGLFGITDLPARYTDADVVAKLREILRKGGAALCAAFLCLGLFADTNRVQTARKDSIYNDAQVVTNVNFAGIATETYVQQQVQQAVGMTLENTTNISKRVAADVVKKSIETNLVAAATMPPWLSTTEGHAPGQIGTVVEYYYNRRNYQWGVDFASMAVHAKEAEEADKAYRLYTPGGYGPYPWSLEFDGNVFQDNGGRLVANKRNPLSGAIESTKTNAWLSDVETLQTQLNNLSSHKQNIIQIPTATMMEAGDRTYDDVVQYIGTTTSKYHFGYFYKMRTYSPRAWDVVTPVDLSGYVPTSRKVNGQPLTGDITIEGMTDNALVLNNNAVKTKSGTAITAAQVGAVSTAQLSPVSTAANNALAYGQGIYQYMHANTNAWFEGTNYNVDVAQSLNKVKYSPEAWENVAYTPCSLQLYEIRNGSRQCVWDQRDWTVYYWNFKSAQLSNNLATATANLSNSVANNYMRKGWAKYTAVNGVTNPANDTLWVDTSKVSLMAGKQWEKMIELGGAGYWTLTGNGVTISTNVAQSTFLSIKDFEGNACLTFRKTSSYLVYCECGTEITGQLYDGQGRVCFTVNTDTCPIAEFTTVLEDDTFVEQGATGCPADYEWTGSAGAWVCHFKLKSGIVSNACFARFKVEHEGENVVEHTVPVKLDGGIVFTQGGTQYKIKPSISGGNVVWSVVQ